MTDSLWRNDLKVVYLYDIGSAKALSKFMVPGWITLVAVVSGSITFSESSSGAKIAAGDIYAVPGSAAVDSLSGVLRIWLVSCTAEFAVSSRIIRFGTGYMEIFARKESPVLAVNAKELRHVVSLLRLLKKKIGSKHAAFKDEMVLLYFNMIVYEYIDLRYKYGKSTAMLHYRNDKIVVDFISLVQQNSPRHHNVKFYAECLYVSSGHLGKAVKAVLGISAKRFIEMAVLSEAYLLLADTQLSISELAEQLNFDSPAAFSGFFKKNTRLSPTQYRLSLKF
ncbi:helix-turn-helix domain-containing protein [Flavobacterium plurextorum]|uniref:helix-turn-helix domain-containing protein n=1 Tax=Flavobacterium TaxID=237 RepID=UPI00351A344D